MADIMAVLDRARACEQETLAQLEHIERLHRIASRAMSGRQRSEQIADKLAVLERELNVQIDRTADAKLEALEYISILEGEERAVIERYFMLAQSWQQIADKMYMSDRRVFLLRKSALEKIREHFGGMPRRSDPLRRSESRI